MKHKLVILEDSSQSLWGGGQKVTFYLADAIHSLFDITIIDSINSPLLLAANKLQNTVCEALNISQNDFLFNIKLLTSTVAKVIKIRPSTVYVPTRKQTLAALVCRIFHPRLKIISHFHLTSERFSLKRLVDILALMGSDRVVFASEYLLQYTQNSFPKMLKSRLTRKSAIFPLPICNIDPYELLLLPELPRDVINIVFCGKIAKNKGIFVLLDAIERLQLKDDFVVTIAGEGPDSEEMKHRIEASAKCDHYRVLGHIKTDEFFWSKASMVVVPSFEHIETIGLSAYEAAVYGVPLICAEQGNLIELINQGYARGLKEPNPELLASLIAELACEIRQSIQKRTTRSWLVKSKKDFDLEVQALMAGS